ncbi:flagellar hook-associated protein FlgK [Dermatophilaceae bacterium Soc4.6]
MTGTFGSFTTALSALNYTRVAMDVASSNIANVSTDGYTRRRVEAASVGGPTQPAMWSRYDGHGDGVTVTGVSRLTDGLLDSRMRTEHGNQSYLDVRQTALDRLEQGVGEPGTTGVSAALADFRASWHDLVNNPGNAAARSQVLGRATTLAEGIAAQSRQIAATQGDQRLQLSSVVGEVNSLATGLADANRAIASGTMAGADVSTLLDTRDQLTLRLTELTGGTASIRSDGGSDFAVAGLSLVSGKDASVFRVASGVTATGSADGNPVTFSLTAPGGSAATLSTPPRGEVGALAELIDVTLPAYQVGLDAVAQQLADTVNTQHQGGFDAAGNPGVALFAYTAGSPASSLTVAISDPALLAASSISGGVLDGGNADLLGATSGVEGSYQQLVNGLGTTVQAARRAAGNQQVLTNQFDGAHEQLAGVNLDEETVTMMQNQRAFEAASKVLSTLDSVLDTLINRMLV